MNSTTHITQPSFIQQKQTNDQVSKLLTLKNEIIDKMQHIDMLNCVYKQKSEVAFLTTFSKIMYQLSDQLKNAVQAYQNIDQQIQRDPKCVFLRKQVQFFKQQKQLMTQVHQVQLQRLKQIKLKNAQLKQRKIELKKQALRRQQKYYTYRNKNKSLSLQINNVSCFQISDKRVTQSTKLPTSVQNTRILYSENNTRIMTAGQFTQRINSQRKNSSQRNKQYIKNDTTINISQQKKSRNKFFRQFQTQKVVSKLKDKMNFSVKRQLKDTAQESRRKVHTSQKHISKVIQGLYV